MSTRRKTAEIITLLYETTTGPPINLDEPPALNPTGGGVRKIQASFKGLKFKKDTSRPGGGVFIAHGKAKEADYTDIVEGTVVIPGSDEEESEGTRSVAIVGNYAQASGIDQGAENFANVNPLLNGATVAGSSDVRVLNMLDMPQAPHTLEQFTVADSGLLEGLPRSMFDWPQWESFFSRFSASTDHSALAAMAQAGQAVPMNGVQQQNQESHATGGSASDIPR